MYFININTLEFPRHEGDIRLEHPDMGETFVCPPDFAVVTLNAVPSFDASTQIVELGTPYKRNDQWFVDYVVINLSAEAIANKNKKPAELSPQGVIKQKILDIEKGLI